MSTIDLVNAAVNSDTGMQVKNALIAGLSSVEGGKPEDLYQNEEGKYDPEVLKRTVARTLATSPQAGELYEKALDLNVQGVPVGAMATQLIRAPQVTYKVNKKSDIGGIALSGAKDYYDERNFQGAKAQTLSGMGQAVNELAMKQQQATNKVTGYYAAEKALKTTKNMPWFDGQEFDPDKLIELADKEFFAETGRHLTDDEKQYAWDALKKGYKRGFAKKGMAVVYSNKPGGLNGQRYAAALDTVGRHREQTAQRSQLIAGALQQANEKVNKVLEMQGPEKRVKGPRVNIGKLMDTYKQLQEQDKLMKNGGGVKTSAADNPTLLSALSREDFLARPAGITRVLYPRNFDEEGGASRYAAALEHTDRGAVTDNEIMSLKTSLSKYFRERMIDDDKLFELKNIDEPIQS